MNRYLFTSLTLNLGLAAAQSGCEWIGGSVNTGGYEIEELQVVASASYARGDDVYLGLEDGRIVKASDSDLSKPWSELGNPFGFGPRLLFAASSGTLFASADGQSLYRAEVDKPTWEVVLSEPVWRMTEDDRGALYAGNYIKDAEHKATLYKSEDDGRTWCVVFTDVANHHIHTVRWDDRAKRLHIAYGDGPTRGQACSDDRGASWMVLAAGPSQGHTDATFTRYYVLWCSDDQSGRIHRVARATGEVQTLFSDHQFIWFGVSNEYQVYVGTIVARPLQRASLLASTDQGATWQKLMQTPWSWGAYTQSFYAESRELSDGGWLYFTTTTLQGQKSYRVRHALSVRP